MKNKIKKTWIIGASTGIGAALAIELAKRGEVLCLSARNKTKLVKLQNELKKINSLPHIIKRCDISKKNEIKSAVGFVWKNWQEIDRVIFMAGVYHPSSFSNIKLDWLDKIIDINLKSAFLLVHYVLPFLEKQKKSQIVFCASVAGYRGLPMAQPYAASKAGLINMVESLRAEMASKIDVKLINPGFVATPMTSKNKFHMPLKITAQRAAIYIVSRLDSKKFEIHFPKIFTYGVKFLRLVPNWFYFKLVAKK